MKAIGIHIVKVYATTDKKKLSDGTSKKYDYGAINLRSPELFQYIGQKVRIKIEPIPNKNGRVRE